MNPLEDIEARCPWCDAPILVRIDVSAGSQCYIEDCQVCCAPILVRIELDPERPDGLDLILRRDGD